MAWNLLKDLPNSFGGTLPEIFVALKTLWENTKRLNQIFQPANYSSLIPYGKTLADMIASMGATSSTLYINSSVTIATDLTIPSNIVPETIKGGSFDVATGVTLTMRVPRAGRFQIFFGDGSVSFSDAGTIFPEWFGDGGIQKAHDAIGALYGGRISLEGVNETDEEIVISKRGVYISGAQPANEPNGVADADSLTQIRYTGAQDDTAAVIRVESSAHNFSAKNLFFNANDLAGFGLYQEGASSPSALTRGGSMDSLAFRGYRVKGWVIGDDTDTLNDAQFQQIAARNIWLRGGADSTEADGIHVNAQNLEFLTITGLYIDPRSSENRHHRNHIRQIAGGITITSMLSTRAGTSTTVDGYAIYSLDSIIINGWRSEDRYLLQTGAATVRAPSFVSGLIQRPDSPAETVSTDPVIDINHTVGSLTLVSPRVNGSIRLGATSIKLVQVQGAIFARAGGGFVYSGPRNTAGLFHDITTGNMLLAGSAPGLTLATEDGTVRWSMVDGTISTPARTLSQITSNQNDYAIGAGEFFRLSTDAARSITGIAGGSAGRRILLLQTSAFALTLVHQSGSSSSANRILSVSGLDIVLNQNEMAAMVWDSTTNRWRAWKTALQSGTVTGVLTITGLLTAEAGVIIGLGGSAQGMLFRTATNGLGIRGYTGTNNDLNLRAADDTMVCRVPVGKSNLLMDRRLQERQGTSTAAANDLTLPGDGNLFLISGNTQINGIAVEDWQAGAEIDLLFSGTPTVKHNTAASAGFASLKLQGSVDLVAAADTLLTLRYDGTVWQEKSRKTA